MSAVVIFNLHMKIYGKLGQDITNIGKCRFATYQGDGGDPFGM